MTLSPRFDRVDAVVGREVGLADGRSRRGGEPLGQHLDVRVLELRVQHLVEVLGGDALDGLVVADLPLAALGHVDRHPQRRHSGALADARLEHPELALIDGELGVAHVAVVRFELVEDAHQLLVDLREARLERRQRLGLADAGHHVFALGVDEEITVGLVLAGRRRCE